MNGSHERKANRPSRARPLTVDEALQYSPLSSIAPFNPDIFPYPSAVPPTPSKSLLSREERAAVHKSVRAAGSENTSPNGTSARLQETLQELRQLLQSDGSPILKFKTPAHSLDTRDLKTPSKRLSNGNEDSNRTSALSNMASLLLESTDLSSRYRTPASPLSQTGQKNAPFQVERAKPPKIHAQSTQSHVRLTNQAAHSQNSQIPAQADAGLPPSLTTSAPVVIISGLPESSQRTEYKSFPNLDEKVEPKEHASKKRKRAGSDEDAVPISIDHRQRADAAVQHLHSLMTEVFEAEDQLQPDTSGKISDNSTQLFQKSPLLEKDISVLHQDALVRLEAAIQKVISCGRFTALSTEHLSRLQKLCEAATFPLETTNIALTDSGGEDDVEQWVTRLQAFENGLQAARIILRIATAGSEEKQLYSEELIQSITNGLKNIIDSCLIPAIECRSSNAESFRILSSEKSRLCSLLHHAGRIFKLLGDLLLKIDVSESVITTIEFLATRLIFVENAPSEKESVLGIQKFESVRRVAMDVVAKVFLRYPDQRISIFDEILTSLEKLPVTRQSARQYKMANGKPIQLVSALVMRLIQTTTLLVDQHGKSSTLPKSNGLEVDRDIDDSVQSYSPTRSGPAEANSFALESDKSCDVPKLMSIARPLYDSAQINAQYLVKYLVKRASTATKTGDLPYRHLLEIFTEDFIDVLGSADWPAAELILRVLLSSLLSIAENEKSGIQAKNMALDFMGLMGSGISDLQTHVRQAARSLEATGSDLAAQLIRISNDILDDKLGEKEMLHFDGPYRGVLEYILNRDINDAQLRSAYGFHVVHWAKNVWTAYGPSENGPNNPSVGNTRLGDLCSALKRMIKDPQWLQDEYDFDAPTSVEGSLSAALVLLNSPFCRAWKRIFSVLLSSLGSSHATTKSRSLKSVVQLLEKDPSILDRGNYVMNHIVHCTLDGSSMVRDSALNLIGKCLSLRPSLDREFTEKVVARASDAGISVRKRAMRILKDIYLRNEDKHLKSLIAQALLQRVKDTDEGVRELARLTFEEICLIPFYGVKADGEPPAHYKLALPNQVSLLVQTVQRGESVSQALESFLQAALSATAKNSAANFNVSKFMVILMFDGIIDNEALPNKPSQPQILQTLMVFAKADPGLFAAEQLELLQPYIENLSTSEDLAVYHAVIVIFRHVLPRLSAPQQGMLVKVQQALLNNVPKLGKVELSEVSMCLWTINGVLKNTDRLVRLMISVLNGIYTAKDADFSRAENEAVAKRVIRYARIAGHFGKVCDLETHVASFKTKFPWWKGNTVSGLIVDMLCPLAQDKQPPALREMALESIGMLCQAWPTQYLRPDVGDVFEGVFNRQERQLENVLLSAFRDFFAYEESRSKDSATVEGSEGPVTGSKRLGRSLVASESDGVSTSIAQRFLRHMLQIALSSADDLALTATQVIVSISRQGLVHPKECGPAIVALATSSHPVISNIAYQEHRNLHHKHESMFEKEYMKAVHQAFIYQKDVMQDAQGATKQPYNSKLHLLFEVLKSGSSKVRKKFLTNLCSRIDSDLPRLDVSPNSPQHLLFSRFCLQNLAFFEYSRIDEIFHVVSCLEKVVIDTGTPFAHSIESEILRLGAETLPTDSVVDSGMNGVHLEVDHDRLRHLAVVSMILSMVWETRTHLRRQWGLQKRDGKSKISVKDLNKAPAKVAGITGDKYWERVTEIMNALADAETMKSQCRAFVELMSIDNELKVASSEEDDAELAKAAARYETPSGDESKDAPLPTSNSSRGRKRKSSMSMMSTPSKSGKRTKTKPAGRKMVSSNSEGDEDWD